MTEGDLSKRNQHLAHTRLVRRVRVAVARTKRAVVVPNQTAKAIPYGRPDSRPIEYGLGKGGADLVGMLLGSGRSVALECKTGTGRAGPDQIKWLAAFRRRGGFACVVRSEQDAVEAIDRACRGESE